MSVNTVLGLPLTTATGMIIDTIDNIMEVKHLDCPPLRTNFCHATKTIPAIKEDATTLFIKFKDVQNVLAKNGTYVVLQSPSW